MPPRNYWMLVMTPENFNITRNSGFKVQGATSSQRKKTLRFEPGDRLLFYLSEVRKFSATATMTSKYFEDHTHIWTSPRSEEDFPHRAQIKLDVVLNEEDYIDARIIAPRMEYVRRWPPEAWPLAFTGNLHLIPRNDFTLIEGEMRRIVRVNGTGNKSR
jgi:hypothetical protein